MIRPILRPILSKIAKSILNPDGGGAETRYFIELDSLLNSYYQIAIPLVFTGDYEIEIEFSSTASSLQVLLGSSLSTNNYLRLNSSGNIDFKSSNDGGNSIISATSYNDGKLHTARATRVGTTLQLFVDGVSVGSSTVFVINDNYDLLGNYVANNYFDGIPVNPKFTDNSGAPVTTTFKLDRPTGNTELSAEGNNTLTYVNIPESNRELYQLSGDKTQWNNISSLPQELPAIIEIA